MTEDKLQSHGAALKASWSVEAGVIPMEPSRELTRAWYYTSEHHAEDERHREPQYHAIFAKMRAEALDYYLQVSMPQFSNWARLTFFWM